MVSMIILPEQAFYMIGSIEEAEERAKSSLIIYVNNASRYSKR